MPVDVHLLTTINSFLDGMQNNQLQGKELKILHEDAYWRDLSKTAAYCMPGLLAKSFKLLTSVREQLKQLHEDPDLVASQKQVIGLQAELLQCKNDQLEALQATVKTSVEDTVKAEIRCYSKVVQENLPPAPPAISHETVKSIVQTVVQAEDRSRSFMVFNLAEEEEEQINSKVEEMLLVLDEKPKVEACRLGKRDPENPKVRPVKVTVSTSVAVSQILAKARNLRSSPKHSSVYISQDRSPAEREQHKLLVAELKKKRDADKSKRYYIKNGVICDGGTRQD